MSHCTRNCVLRAVAALLLFACTPIVATAQSSVLVGTIVNASSNQPIRGSLVSVATAGRQVRTDSLGRFRLERLDAGPHALAVQAVGYVPLSVTIHLSEDSTLAVDIDLERVPSELDRVVTTADRVNARSMNYPDFDRRRAAGLGRFVSREEILREQGRSFESLLSSRIPGIRAWDVGGQRVLGSSRGRISVVRGDQRCFVQVIVDNVVRYETGGSLPHFDLRSIDPTMIAAIEFYTVSSTPHEFNRGGNAPCGTLLIWTQH